MKTIKTAFALIKNDNKILLIQEGFYPAFGQWCLPGGHIDEGENSRQAAAREAFEETGGLKVNATDLLLTKVIDNIEYQGRPEENGRLVEVSIHNAQVLSGKVNKDKLTEELDARWFTKEEAKKLPLRWDWLKELF